MYLSYSVYRYRPRSAPDRRIRLFNSRAKAEAFKNLLNSLVTARIRKDCFLSVETAKNVTCYYVHKETFR
jgi:hypothetical protein